MNDRFLSRVVPAILQNSPDFLVDDSTDVLASYISINSDMRRENHEYIASLSVETVPELLWQGSFKQLINTAVESGFADQRDYIYEGDVVDHQTHLGFDLASTAAAPVSAANRGRVVHAGWLGIYGNCVILDHGMGLQSLYAHLSSIDVRVGEMIELDGKLGRSGATGLAGGDHLHFTTLLGGRRCRHDARALVNGTARCGIGCRRSGWSSWGRRRRTVGLRNLNQTTYRPTLRTCRRSTDPGTKPATAVNQLDYAFASRGFHEQVSVRAMNAIEEWGPSDHCRLMIEVKAKESRAARFFQPQRMQKEKKFLEPSSDIVVRKGAPEEKARILEAQKVGEAAKHVVPVDDEEPS